MEINAEREGATVIAKPMGRLDGSNASEFQEALEGAIEESDRGLVLDFEDISYISSAGLRVILLTARTLQGNGGSMALCALDAPIREVFAISGFDTIIPIHATRGEALAAVSG